MPANPAHRIAIAAAENIVSQVRAAPARPWGWAGNHGSYIVRHGYDEVAMFTIIPNIVKYEAALMDDIVDAVRKAQPG